MKILTLVGTRPALIRLSRIIPALDNAFENIFVYSDQNYDVRLRDIFFQDLDIRTPNYSLGAIGDFGTQIGKIFSQIAEIITKEKPDKALILGDTNTTLAAIVCERMGVPVYHLEAGNRCFDKIPEEINRKVVDHSSTINLPYTARSRDNLIKEGFDLKKIFVSGNPIAEVINYYWYKVLQSNICHTLAVTPTRYCLATLHRSENVDNPDRLSAILEAYNRIADEGETIIVSTHPRLKSKLKAVKTLLSGLVVFCPPFNFFDFINLENNCKCLFTDSGTAQEEAAILRIPCVVTRRATERPEILECGASLLGGVETDSIYNTYKQSLKLNRDWKLPKEYTDLNVSNKIVAYLSGGINV